MNDADTQAAAAAVKTIAARLNAQLSSLEVEAAARLIVGLVELATGAALRRAEAAGRAAAEQVTTVEQANAVMEAAAASQEKK